MARWIDYFQELEPMFLLSLLMISDKNGKIRSLEDLWSEQREIIEAVLSGKSIVILKPRQIGSSTACIAALFLTAFLSPDPITICILSYKRESSREIFDKAKFFYESLPLFLRKIHPARITNNQIIFKNTKARIILKGAKDAGGLRSLSITHLLMSELSFMDNAAELLSTALAAVNNGMVILESTANYYGDPLHKTIEQTIYGGTGYKLLFFEWTNHERYKSIPPPGFVLSEDDRREGLTPEQAAWKQETIARFLGDTVKFKREYPRSIEEAYAQLEGSYIQDQFLNKLKKLKSFPDKIIKYQQPQSDTKYTIGVDTAEGTGKDYSSVHVLNARTLDVAAVYRSNSITLTNLATLIADLSYTYGINSINKKALVNIESNSRGSVAINELHRLSIPIYYQNNKPWDTNKKTRPLLYEIVRDSIINSRLKEIDDYTYQDLRSIRQDNYGKFSHSDAIISLGLAIIAANSVSLPTPQPDFPHIKIKR